MTQGFEDKFVNTIICGDCLEVMADWPDKCIDTIITDPPYGLGFMGKGWDTFNTFTPKYIDKALRHGPRGRKGKHLGSDGSYRNRGCGAASEAGFYDYSRNAEFQQWFTGWAREVLRIAKPGAFMLVFGGTRTYHRLACAIEDAGWQIRDCMMWLYGSGFPKSHNIGKKVNGWDGYGTALKPAWEPIIVAMKPLDGTFAHNAEKYGVAGLAIDKARIPAPEGLTKGGCTKYGGVFGSGQSVTNPEGNPQGRWPANVILDEEAAAMLDEQSGELTSGKLVGKYKGSSGKTACYGEYGYTEKNYEKHSGGASRFFYCAKASRAERNAGLEGMEMKVAGSMVANQGKVMDLGGASLKGEHKQIQKVQNTHPTVKPLRLMEYLCKLTMTPTGGIVLDCFGGSGTTAMACVNTGRKYVLIEKDPDYCEITKKRLDEARSQYSLLETQ